MLNSISKSIIFHLFNYANIIVYDEDLPEQVQYDIKIIDESFYYDLLLKKSLGLGEGYMNDK
jgi:hypothetical protein